VDTIKPGFWKDQIGKIQYSVVQSRPQFMQERIGFSNPSFYCRPIQLTAQFSFFSSIPNFFITLYIIQYDDYHLWNACCVQKSELHALFFFSKQNVRKSRSTSLFAAKIIQSLKVQLRLSFLQFRYPPTHLPLQPPSLQPPRLQPPWLQPPRLWLQPASLHLLSTRNQSLLVHVQHISRTSG